MERPLAAPPTAGGAWPSRRTVALLLVLLAAAIASSYWVEIVSRAFNDVDPIVHVPNYDFFQYYAGGYNWNLGLDPYRNHPGVPGAIQHPRFDTHQISGFIYPPTFLPVYGALARYTYEDARHAWLAITLSAFALLIGVALWVTPGRRLEVLGAVLLLTMASYPFIYHVHNGQVDLIAAAFTISGFLLYPRWRGWPSAALLALAVATKVTPVLILAVMVVYFRDWRLALKALLCGVALAALSLVWVHVGLYREFLFTTLPSIAVSDPSQFNQTVLRYWWKYPLVLKSVSALGYLALLFLVFVASRNRRRAPFAPDEFEEERRERYAVLLLAVLFMLFFSPLAWQMAYVWPIVPLALVLTSRPPAGRPVAVVTLGVAAALLCSRIFDVRVLDLLNVIGAAVAMLALMRWYLPLEQAGAVAVPAPAVPERRLGGRRPRSPTSNLRRLRRRDRCDRERGHRRGQLRPSRRPRVGARLAGDPVGVLALGQKVRHRPGRRVVDGVGVGDLEPLRAVQGEPLDGAGRSQVRQALDQAAGDGLEARRGAHQVGRLDRLGHRVDRHLQGVDEAAVHDLALGVSPAHAQEWSAARVAGRGLLDDADPAEGIPDRDAVLLVRGEAERRRRRRARGAGRDRALAGQAGPAAARRAGAEA